VVSSKYSRSEKIEDLQPYISLEYEAKNRYESEYLLSVTVGPDEYRVCLRDQDRNNCTCTYAYIHRFDDRKKCVHELAALKWVRENA